MQHRVRDATSSDQLCARAPSSELSGMENSHAKSSDEVLAFFESNEEFGISEQQVAANLHKYGFNGAPLYEYEYE